MDVAVALPVADGLHERCDGVAEVERDGLAGGGRGVRGGGGVGGLHGVGLGGVGQVERGLGEGEEALGHADQVDDLGRGDRLDHRLGIGQADVLGREDAEAAGDE